MIISSNMTNQLSAIEPLNGSNYGSWMETVEVALVLWEIDPALTTDAPKEPKKHVIHEGDATKAFATRQRDFTPIRWSTSLSV
jgi:hypothetical protein